MDSPQSSAMDQQQQHMEQVVGELKQGLSPEQVDQLDEVLASLGRQHSQRIEVIQHQHAEDLILQLHAMRISVEQIESSRCEVLRSELERETLFRLTTQRAELISSYEERIQSMEKCWGERLSRIQSQLDSTSPQGSAPVSSKSLVRQLERQLQEEHNLLLQKLNQSDRTEEKTDEEKDESSTSDPVQAADLVRLCSRMVAEYERLETVSVKLAESSIILPESSQNLSASKETQDCDSEANVSGWEIEIEDDSLDSSEGNHGEFTVEGNQQVSDSNKKTVQESSKQLDSDANVEELTKKINDLETKLKEHELMKEALDESDKQVKELVAIVNSKDEILTQFESHGDAIKLASDYHVKLSASEDKLNSLEEALEEAEKQNSELSEKLETQRKLYKELEEICQSQERTIEQEKGTVNKLSCDIEERDAKIEGLEQKLGVHVCASEGDRTVDSEIHSTDTSLNESQDEGTRALKEAERRHAREMEEMTQMYNEEQEALRDSLKVARAKELELSDQIEELGHQHEQAVSALKEQLIHDHKVEVETMQSEFDAQKQVEVKRATSELVEKHKEEVEKLHEDYQIKLQELGASSVKEGSYPFSGKQNADSPRAFGGEVDNSQEEHEKHIRELTLEWEEKVEKTRLELEEQWEDEKTELDRKHQQEVTNLQTQLRDSQEKLNGIIEALDCGDFDSPALEAYRVSLREKVDLELEMARKLLQDEYDEQTASLEEFTAQEAANQQAKFIEQHQQMMDKFMSEKESERADMEARHVEALSALQQQLDSRDRAARTDHDLPQKEADVSEVEERHRQEIVRLTEQYEEKLQALRKELMSSHDEQLSAVVMDTDATQSDLEKAHQQELNDLEDRLSEKHRKEIDNLEKQLNGKMEDLVESHEEEIGRLSRRHKQEIGELREQLDQGETTRDNPPAQEIIEELSTASETAILTQHPIDDSSSDLEIEYESSFVDEDSEEGDRSATPTEMVQTLSFQEAEKLAQLSTVIAPDDSLVAPPSEDIEEEIVETADEELAELAELDLVLQENLDQSNSDGDSVEATLHEPLVERELGATASAPAQTISTDVSHAKITELEREVSRLERELTGKSQETEWLQRQLVQQSAQYQDLRVRVANYEQLSGDSLVGMLRADADRLGQERDTIQRANEHLLHLLSNSLRTYMSMEDTINRSLARVVSAGRNAVSPTPATAEGALQQSDSRTDQSAARDSLEGAEEFDTSNKGQIIPDAGGDRVGSPDCNSKTESEDKDRDSSSSEAGQNLSVVSVATDEGLDLSHRITESMFSGPDIDQEGEELLRDGWSRLSSAVSRLCEMMGEGSDQMWESRRVQHELTTTLTATSSDNDRLREQCQELSERVQEEATAKEFLAAELHKAEGLLEGYVVEKSQLQRKLEEMEERIVVLLMDLDTANTKLHELESARSEVDAMRRDVERQQVALQADLGPENQEPTSEASAATEFVEEPALILEINKLNQEKRDMSKQCDKDGERRVSRIRDLEMTVEEMEKRYEDMLDEKKHEIDELLLRVESLDNKLKASRQFIDEQANDREQEREDHAAEVTRLTKVIQDKEKRESAEGRLHREVEDLTEEIQIKTDLMSEASLRNEQLQRDLRARELRSQELEDQVRHLERDLDEKSESERALQQRVARLEDELKQDSSASDDTLDTKRSGDADLRQKISVLEQELEAKERTIYTERGSLEEELRKARLLEEELTNDKAALQKQVYESLHQISQLRTQLDEFKHRFDSGSSAAIVELKQQLEDEREAVDRKEKEVSDLSQQLDQVREQALDADDSAQQLRSQLRVAEQQLQAARDQQNQAHRDLMNENNSLKSRLQRVEYDPTFHQSLLEEKNEEIDHLSQELEKLRADQSAAGDSHATRDLLSTLQLELDQKSRHIEELQQTVDGLQHSDALLDTTVSDNQEMPLMPSLTERMSIQDEFSNALNLKEDELSALQEELQLKEAELSQAKLELETSVSKMESSPLNEALLQEKETTIQQLTVQVDTLHTEVTNLTDFQSKLQEDYDMVQTMLEDKQREIETLTKELTETRPQAEGATDALMKFELEMEALRKQLKEKHNVIEEKEEELYVATERLEEKDSDLAELQKLVEEKEELLTQLHNRYSEKSQNDTDVERLNEAVLEKENAVVNLEQKLTETATELASVKDTLTEKEAAASELERKLKEQGSEQEEALVVLRSQLEIAAKALEERDSQVERLTQELGREDGEEGAQQQITSLQQKLREAEEEKESAEADRDYLSHELDAYRAEVIKHKADALSHQSEASEKHAELELLRQQLADVQSEAERIEALTEELNRTKSQLQLVSASNSALSLDGASDPDIQQLTDELQQARAELDIFKQSAGISAAEVQLKIEDIRKQLADQHAVTVEGMKREAEVELESKLTELSRQHEKEVAQLTENHRKATESAVREATREAEKRWNEERNRLIQKHEQETNQLRAQLTAASEDVAVMEVQHQLSSEVSTAERLDSRLLEHLSRPRQDGVGDDHPDVPFSEPPLNPEETVSDRLRLLMNRLHNEGVQMLTLSELQFLKRHSSPPRVEKEADLPALQAAWDNEKQGLLSAIQALKDLLAQVHANRENEQMAEVGVADWRRDLVSAISQVFARERETLLAELRTHVVASPSTELSNLQRLEQKIREQGDHHKDSMTQVFSVDRQSLLAEIRDLRSHASLTRLQLQEEKQSLTQQLSSTEEQLSKREHHLQRQLELSEYRLKQEQVLQEDLKASLSGETTRNAELQSLLNREHQTTLDLQMELTEAQVEADRLRDSLEQEENRLKSVSDAIEKERAQGTRLADQLEEERSEVRRLKRAAEEDRRKMGQLQENEVNLLQTLQTELDKERDLHAEVNTSLEREKLQVENLRRDLQFEKENLLSVENQFKSRLSQLQTHLESERARCQELHAAISREQALNNQLRNSLEEERGNGQALTHREQSMIADLKALLAAERERVAELQTAIQRDRSHVTSLTVELDETKRQMGESLEREREACRELKRQLSQAQEQTLQLSRQHEVDAGRSAVLERDLSQLRSEIGGVRELAAEREAQRDGERVAETRRVREVERDRDDKATKLHESELEIRRLRQKASDLDLQLTSARQLSPRSTSQVHQTTSPRPTDTTDSADSRLSELRDRLSLYRTQLEASRQRLHLLLVKHQDDLNRSETSIPYGEMVSRRKALDDLLSEVQQLQRPLQLESESRPSISNTPSLAAMNDRVMKHNTELTGFVARLSQEKAQLRDNLTHLETELKHSRQREADLKLRGRLDLSESALLAERATWNQERITLQMSLDHATSEVERLKTDLRAEQHRLMRLTNAFPADADTDKMQRLYGKYLRSESFRKALVYQKHYLLLLLGGFQNCEETTLAIIARMGVYPSQEDVQRRSRHSKAFSTFRTAARVVVAIHRMRYLVKKWRRATKVGSPVVTGNTQLQHGYLSTAVTYSPSRPLTHTQSAVEVSQSASWRSSLPYSPHSPAYLAQSSSYTVSPRVGHTSARTPPTRDRSQRLASTIRSDPSPSIRRKLLSELDQREDNSARNGHHDPDNDQSLHDDYINRLESLQQRLGGINDPGNMRTKPHWSSVRR